MLRNYFKTAFRTIARNKNYTFINVAGLASGMAVCLLIFIIIQYELSYDNFHTKKDRIFRVLTEYHHADADIFYGLAVPFGLPASVKNHLPEVESVAPIYSEGNDQVLVLDNEGEVVKKFKEEKGVLFTEPSFFRIFDFPFLSGDPATALNEPNTAVLTKETAEKYFGDWHKAIGKTIKWNNQSVLKITGILKTIPDNTDFGLKIVIAYGTGYTADFARSTDWESTRSAFGCYILLQPNSSIQSFNAKLRALSKKMEPADDKDSHIIQALSQVHYDTKVGDLSGKTISPALIRGLWLIAGFILLIACVNFINLSTAQAINRAKEVGVRKVLGSNRSQLRLQFLTETVVIVFAAAILSIFISALALRSIGRILDLPLKFDLLANPAIILFLIIVTIIVTAIAGFYPSVVLSGFKPVQALKSKFISKSSGGISLRRGLVVFQFIIAQALIIGTLVIARQMNYFINQPLGFDKDAIVNIPFPSDSIGLSKLDYLKKELSGIKGIRDLSFSSNTPVEDDNDNWTTFKFDHAAKETDFFAIIKCTDNQYLSTYKLPLIAGRDLEASDTAREFLVDESLLKKLGVADPKDGIGKEISMNDGHVRGPIVGVLKEFNSRSFRRDLAPVILTTLKAGYNNAGIKLTSNDASAAMAAIERAWGKVFPDYVFEYKFLDAKIGSFYKQERQLSQLYRIFAALAIFLSCLGLYGLASFMAAQRIKEVGIRKVLGATVNNIIHLFSKEFAILIGIAFLIASPVAWYFMHQWLQDYVYRINIGYWVFMLGGLLSLIIALITISFQAIKAAAANPVKSLRTE